MSRLDVQIRGKTYPSRTPGADHAALGAIDFHVPEGQFAAIVGPSGCGKSTLLNIIGGLDRDFGGTLSFNGAALNEAHLGYVFQTPRLMPWLSVLDNIELVLDPEARKNGLARELLAAMGLSDVAEAFPNRLSGGMQRRAALARAFVIRPRLLLMDEPFVSLDQPTAESLRRLLLDIWSRKPTTVLFVTHDLDEALFLADRVLFLSPSPGRILLDFTVPLTRPRAALKADAVSQLRHRLIAEHPGLLSGVVSA